MGFQKGQLPFVQASSSLEVYEALFASLLLNCGSDVEVWRWAVRTVNCFNHEGLLSVTKLLCS